MRHMKHTALAMLLAALLVLGGCATDDAATQIKISFSASTAASYSSDARILYVEQALDSLTLEGVLEMEGGEVVVSVGDVAQRINVWHTTFTEGGKFSADLGEVEAGAQFLLAVEATDNVRTTLTVTSPAGLSREKETPELYNVGKPGA